MTRRSLFFVSVVIPLGILGYLSLSRPSEPGLYEDEAWGAIHATRFVNGAPSIEGTLGREFRLFGRAFPFMRNSYVGPIKTYVLIPALAIFGPSTELFHVVGAMFALTCVLLLFVAMWRSLGYVAAMSSSLLLATDLSFIIGTRTDWGPVAFALAVTSGSLFAVLAWVRSPGRYAYGALTGFLLGLGVSHKLDYLAVCTAMAISLVLVFRKLVFEFRRQVIVGAVCWILGAAPIIAFNVVTRGESIREGRGMARANRGLAFPPTIEQLRVVPTEIKGRHDGIQGLLRGVQLADWTTQGRLGNEAPFGPSRVPLAFGIGIAVVLIAASFRRQLEAIRAGMFLIVWYVALVVLLGLTPMAVGPHHALLAYPLPHAVIGAAAGVATTSLGSSGRSALRAAVRTAVLVPILMLVLLNMTLAQAYLMKLDRHGGKGYFSGRALENLITAITTTHRDKSIQLLDWGFEQPIRVLTRDRADIHAAFWRLLLQEDTGGVLGELIEDRRNVFVMHSSGNESMPKAKELFLRHCRENSIELHEQIIRTRDGAPFTVIVWRKD